MARSAKQPSEPSIASKLEDAILADPDDDAAYLVYADWLLAQNDPRGELIVLQHQAEEADGARRAKLRRTASQFLESHATYFLGPLHERSKGRKYEDDARYEAHWRTGYVRRLELDWSRSGAYDPDLVCKELAAILEHPSFRFVLDLQLGPVFFHSRYADVQEVVATLVAIRRPEALRTLSLGHTSVSDVSTGTADFGALTATLGQLRKITLRERNFDRAKPSDKVHEMTIRRRRS